MQGGAAAPLWSALGRVAARSFGTDVDRTAMKGEVATGKFGTDMENGRWLGGIAVEPGNGEEPFTVASDSPSACASGSVESSLTAVYPLCAAWCVGAAVSLGYGQPRTRRNGDRKNGRLSA